MSNHTLIIAEAGVNHNGDLQMARQLIDAAAAAGADYVKFQTFRAENLVSPDARKAEYQAKNTGDGDDSQFNMLKKLELSAEDHAVLINHCREKGIRFFSTAFDLESLAFLDRLGMDCYKIPSGELTNYPYLCAVAALKKPVILSTGMATMEEISESLEVLTAHGLEKDQLTILHCNTEYPTPMEDVNLKAMQGIGDALGVAVGYSDHTLGIEVPIAAVALGATVIEKHFTLNRNLPGPDHKASLEPDELKAMVTAIRNIEKAMSGSGLKAPSKSESRNMAIARKSLHLSRALPAGHILGEADLQALRPGDGISPMRWNEVLGKQLKSALPALHRLSWEDLQ